LEKYSAYIEYRTSDRSSNEAHAWSMVDAFVRENDLTGARVIDLGCGFGSPAIASWSPTAYYGYDISDALLARHLLRGRPSVHLAQTDLEELSAFETPLPREGQDELVLSTFALHYLESPAPLLRKMARPGVWFCLVVANAQHDRPFCLEGSIVNLVQNGMKFTYFLHELSDYVRWLEYPPVMFAKQCGVSRTEGEQLPYYLIAGHW